MLWVSVKDRQPTEEGWYLVWAPGYLPGSSSSKEKVGKGYMFAKFRPTHKFPWSIENDWSKGMVKYWMPLPREPMEMEENHE